MKLWTLIIVGFALGISGCAKKDQGTAGTTDELPGAETAAEDAERARIEASLKHMHRHAEFLDTLNMALAEGDFDAAMTPAYWLSRHDVPKDIPSDWEPYLDSMREAARGVAASDDLESARVAAERITAECQGCHAAAGLLDDQASHP